MNIASDFKTRSLGYILTSCSLIVAMSYNEFAKQAINTYFPLQSDTLIAKFIYALILTLVLILLFDLFKKFDEEVTIANTTRKI